MFYILLTIHWMHEGNLGFSILLKDLQHAECSWLTFQLEDNPLYPPAWWSHNVFKGSVSEPVFVRSLHDKDFSNSQNPQRSICDSFPTQNFIQVQPIVLSLNVSVKWDLYPDTNINLWRTNMGIGLCGKTRINNTHIKGEQLYDEVATAVFLETPFPVFFT